MQKIHSEIAYLRLATADGISANTEPQILNQRLQTDVGVDTLSSMDPQGERDLTDKKIEALEARTDAKFARLDGKLDLVLERVSAVQKEVGDFKIDNKTTRSTVVVTAVTSTIAIIGVLITVMAYGAASWYNGTVLFDHLKAMAQPAQPPK